MKEVLQQTETCNNRKKVGKIIIFMNISIGIFPYGADERTYLPKVALAASATCRCRVIKSVSMALSKRRPDKKIT